MDKIVVRGGVPLRGEIAVSGSKNAALPLLLAVTGCGPIDWVMFHFGPDHAGFTPDTSISQDAVSSSMVLNWTAATTGIIDRSVRMMWR